ncbi:glycosidase [Clostridium sp. E02]|uniref:glycosidase n=1 Tax=Clostridium sp. E02 TaxID=2487134 RepID=UPI0019D06442|nr:glycosidase [Clostridium sp. E02]
MNREMDVIANNGPMLNAYPDSIGGTLEDIVWFLKQPELKNAFSSFYILPSIFNTDLDRGFSVIDYSLNELFVKNDELKALEELNIDLKLDFILNHASVLSKQFQDILRHGENSKYKDFFINWNKFWEGHGKMTEEGYIQPYPELIKNMFFRKSGLPILMVRMPDGTNVPYWNTFYQEIQYPNVDAQDIMRVTNIQYTSADTLAKIVNASIEDGEKLFEIPFGIYEKYKKEVIELLESNRKYLGQMDLNIKSPLVWEFYDETLKTLAGYGAKIVRLDAFAYAPKEAGEKNFLNEPGTWEVLEKVKGLADQYNLTLLPEIHASYEAKTYEHLAQKGYMTYDFFLPGLIIDALESKNGELLASWALELQEKEIRVVNMLGCHDGIPLLDLKGMIPEERIDVLMKTIVDRNGYIKNLHGQKNVYYQVNATYYSALGEDDKKMLLARALQLFMPGKPQVWYLDLFAGINDIEGMKKAGAGGHKEINRTNLTKEQIQEKMKTDVVQKQIAMLNFRTTFPAFSFDSHMEVKSDKQKLEFIWKKDGYTAYLKADLDTVSLQMAGEDKEGNCIFELSI